MYTNNLPSSDGRIQSPRYIGCSKHKNALIIISNTYSYSKKTNQNKQISCVTFSITECKTAAPPSPLNSPCIWTRNSVFIRRAASLSLSLLEPQRESISSIKMMEGLCCRAKLNKFFTNLEKEEAEITMSCLVHTHCVYHYSKILAFSSLGSLFIPNPEAQIYWKNIACNIEVAVSVPWPGYFNVLPWSGTHQDLLFTLAQPFGHQIRWGNGEEGWVVGFSGHCFSQVGFPCTRRAKKQDPSPWSSLSWEWDIAQLHCKLKT